MSLLLVHTQTSELGGLVQDAVFAGSLLALAASAVFLCHALVRRGLAAQLWKVLASSVRRDETAMQELIAERLRAESQSNCLGLNLFFFSWLLMNNGLVLYNIAAGAARWMTFWQDVLWIWATFCSVICQVALRRSARHSTVPAVYVCHSVLQLAFVALGPAKQVPYLAVAGFSVWFRLLWSLACMRLPLVAFTTILHFVCACVGFMHTEGDDGAGSNMGVFVPSEFIGDIAILSCTVVWRHFCSLRVLHEIQGSISQSGNQAARSLLNIVCDATVELDKELNITDQAPRFASLLQHGYDRSLKGSQMLQFIVPEDKPLFTDRVSASVEDSDHSMANVFHMRVRDSINNVLSVEVFHVPVTNYFAGDSHLIGVREYTDAADNVGVLPKMGRKKGRAQGTRSRTARVTPAPSDEPPGGAGAPGADVDAAHESGGSGPPSPMSSWSSLSCEQGEDHSSEIAAWIDVLSECWDIKSCTNGFQLFYEAAPRVHGSPIGKGELLRWIKPDHRDSLIRWVQDTYQEMRSLRSAVPVPSPAPRFFEQPIHFRPPVLRRVRVRVAYAARVALALPEECLLQNTLAKLVFFDVRLLQQEDLQNTVSAL